MKPARKVKVPLQRKPGTDDLPLPAYHSADASGMDLLAAVEKDLVVKRGEVMLVPTGISVAIPRGYEAQIRPRSGLALKHGIAVVNSPGTIDADYRGEIAVILTNLLDRPFTLKRGMRIAQMVIAPVVQVDLVPVDELPASERGGGGFGHTGVSRAKAREQE
ncbi:MAG: dUTP diphosphatase [Planctomycetota bacterium]